MEISRNTRIKYNRFLTKMRCKCKPLWSFLTYLNLILRHWDLREHKHSFGKLNPDKTFYVVRADDNFGEGLLSLYVNRGTVIERSHSKGYISVVDFQNYKTLYNLEDEFMGTRNAWEYYFEQPSSYTLDEVYQSKNVILSGWKLKGSGLSHAYYVCGKKWMDPVELKSISSFFLKHINVKPYIYSIADNEYKRLFSSDEVVLGVFIRGTTYVNSRPYHHAIQPTVNELMDKIDKYTKTYPINKVFLATEDASYVDIIKKKFGGMVVTYYGNNTVGKEFKDNGFLEEMKKTKKNNYELGLGYLISMILLARTDYLVSSNANGSVFVNIINDGRYRDKYIFDCGLYE